MTLFYGFGLGLFGRVSYGVALLIAIAVFLLLATLARAWLARFAQGPMEALWRRLSYRRAADRPSPARTKWLRAGLPLSSRNGAAPWAAL